MMQSSNLETIRKKIRRLTGRTSENQITNKEIDEYINTFYQFDFPDNIRLGSNSQTFSFITTANVGDYKLLAQDPSNPKFDEIVVSSSGSMESAGDVYCNFHAPAFVNNVQVEIFQSREQFLRCYPTTGNISSSLKGSGSTGVYSIKLPSSPILAASVTIGVIDSTGSTIKCVDVPNSREFGDFWSSDLSVKMTGDINYLTGAISISFPNTIPIGEELTFTFATYEPNRSAAVLLHGNSMTLRPVPDKPYPVSFTAFLTPVALIDNSDNPILKQWWQYLAYGAAKKIFEDSADAEGLNQIMPAFKEQETLALYRHIVQQTNEQVATIYSQNRTSGGGFFGF